MAGLLLSLGWFQLRLLLAVIILLSAYFGPPLLFDSPPPPPPSSPPGSSSSGGCPPHEYTTTLISLDPLVIYIQNFVSAEESAEIIRIGTPLLRESPVTGYGADVGGSQARTSWSAPLPNSHSHSDQDTDTDTDTGRAVECVLSRAEHFLGTLLSPGRDEIGQAQLVRYTDGQKFDLHHDWFRQPRLLESDRESGRRRLYNRVATLFVTLQADFNFTRGIISGETWFPHVRPITPQQHHHQQHRRLWREHEHGGLAFRAIPGNALFWVNLFPNGTGDHRTLHAGLPVRNGTKTAMNIWPRVFFGPDA
ncbi:hypothetical protein QBC46DRAFT_438249 [Diplogelasinospora grovesii]|uniref:Prolyl 4-hydroxylase alpha subunit domain-containing protein n=1 Tax=Diplogelasinospora grovesii TaxID=303347 RepID=A0AAN6S3P3_9PEZI|nr:hypothetical protein QBC46DRAFT_438249 [Diplogelasinospora grovesii]